MEKAWIAADPGPFIFNFNKMQKAVPSKSGRLMYNIQLPYEYNCCSECCSDDLFDGEAVVGQGDETGVLHIIEDRRVLEISLGDDGALGPSAAENYGIL